MILNLHIVTLQIFGPLCWLFGDPAPNFLCSGCQMWSVALSSSPETKKRPKQIWKKNLKWCQDLPPLFMCERCFEDFEQTNAPSTRPTPQKNDFRKTAKENLEAPD